MKKRGSIGKKILLIMVLITISNAAIVGAFSYTIHRRDTIEINAGKALNIAEAVAASIDGGRMREILASGEADEYWYERKVYIDEVMARTGVMFLYLLDTNHEGGEVTYFMEGMTADSDLHELGLGSRESEAVHADELFETLRTGISSATGIYRAGDYGTVVSGFAAIFDADGVVAGVVGVDKNIDDVMVSSRYFGMVILICVAGFSVLFCLICNWLIHYGVGKPIEALTNFEQILNGLDTMIYVTDTDTDKILFINNNMKQHFGLGGESIGKRCYEVLQEGISERCEFCPCHKLDVEPDITVIWEEHSTATGRYYRNSDRYISWLDGRKVHMQHSIDVTDMKKAVNALDKQFEQKSIMSDISQSFLYNSENIDALVAESLCSVGESMGISQLRLFLPDETGRVFSCVNEWIDPQSGLTSFVGESVELTDELAVLLSEKNESGMTYISSDDSEARAVMMPYNMPVPHYLITFIFLGEKLYASLEYSRVSGGEWSQEEMDAAAMFSNNMAGAFHKREAERQLIAAKELAEKNDRSKSDFLAKMSHEIRTPMNAVIGISEIELNRENNTQQTNDAFGRIYNSSYNLLGIVNDILDFSKIEAGNFEFIPVRYETASLISDTVQQNTLRVKNKKIGFELRVSENLPAYMYGDELRIRQIINNLLSNALKYTEKGRVVLEFFSIDSNPEAQDCLFVIKVSDTGRGMTEEQVSKIFDEYMRFNTEFNRTTEGIGLGMSITKNLIVMMNGTIKVESEPGVGSVFTVKLPQEISEPGFIGKETAENLRNFRVTGDDKTKVRIERDYMPYGSVLVVDDMEDNLFVAHGLLSLYGLKIDTASSGFEALEKMQNGAEYDIIFMDHMMPKM
ncbi:MAG: response regulator, partial [Clostridiales bacterium]|nr:response regulator [Clostridiales bacterium]